MKRTVWRPVYMVQLAILLTLAVVMAAPALAVDEPHTTIHITATPMVVPPGGGTVTLTITETNDGNVDFPDAQVVLGVQGLIALLDSTSMGFSSNQNGDSTLAVGETWTWNLAAGAPTTITYSVRGVTFFMGNTANQDAVTITVAEDWTPEEWSVYMTASTASEGTNSNLAFGARFGATDGLDPADDVPHPPPGPGATFDAYFVISDIQYPHLDQDYRAPKEFIVWSLEVKSNTGVILTWNSIVPENISLKLAGAGLNVDMKSTSTAGIAAGTHSLTITASFYREIQLSLKTGWNMVSVPLKLPDNSASAVFPGAAGIFTWDPVAQSYSVPATIDPKKGYWVAVSEDSNFTLSGIPASTWTANVTGGWNMIGSIFTDIGFTRPHDSPDGSVMTTLYSWDPVGKTYVLESHIEPGKGYWVATVQNCSLTLP